MLPSPFDTARLPRAQRATPAASKSRISRLRAHGLVALGTLTASLVAGCTGVVSLVGRFGELGASRTIPHTAPKPVAKAGARSEASLLPPRSARLASGPEPFDGWALKPGAVGVAARIGSAHGVLPKVQVEWDFEASDDPPFGAQDGWTVRSGQTLGPRCGRVAPPPDAMGLVPADTVGGDYWQSTYWPGQSGDCFVDTAGERATIASPPFELGPEARVVSLLLGGGEATEGDVEVEVNGRIVGTLANARAQPGMSRREIELPQTLFGQAARVLIVSRGGRGLRVDDVVVTDGLLPWSEPAPVWGAVDLHNHMLNHLTYGGRLIAGRASRKRLAADRLVEAAIGTSSAETLEGALADCSHNHGRAPGGGALSITPDSFVHDRRGAPRFQGWPGVRSSVHQQVYIDWLRRAWQGGVRIVQLDAGNSEFAAHVFDTVNVWLSGPKNPLELRDNAAVARTVAASWELFSDPEAASFAEIALTPAMARDIVSRGKLAIVLGVEVDSIGELYGQVPSHTPLEDRLSPRRSRALPLDAALARGQLARMLGCLKAAGVAHLVPIHVVENAYGYPAVYNRAFDIDSRWSNGHDFALDDGSGQGVRFRLDDDNVNNSALLSFALTAINGIDASFDPLRQSAGCHCVGFAGGHIAAGGLKPAGRELLEQMMRLGLLIDIEHMSDRAANETLTMAEERHVPVMLSHTSFREIAFGFHANAPWNARDITRTAVIYDTAEVERIASERFRSPEQVRRVAALGGMVGVGLGTPSVGTAWGSFPANCDDTSVTWAHAYEYARQQTAGRGLAFGSDANGLAQLPKPRFGPDACYGAHDDDYRKTMIKDMADSQRNGVAYVSASWSAGLADVAALRLADYGPGFAYSGPEVDVWAGLALADVTRGLSVPSKAFASMAMVDLRAATRDPRAGERILRYAKGFWAKQHDASRADLDRRVGVLGALSGDPDELEARAFDVFPAGYDEAEARANAPPESEREPGYVERVVSAWLAMHGPNTPIKKYCVKDAGGACIRDFDVNLEGVAHYGLLPDFWQDVRHVDDAHDALAALFMGAEDYIEMWERALEAATLLAGPKLSPSGYPKEAIEDLEACLDSAGQSVN